MTWTCDQQRHVRQVVPVMFRDGLTLEQIRQVLGVKSVSHVRHYLGGLTAADRGTATLEFWKERCADLRQSVPPADGVPVGTTAGSAGVDGLLAMDGEPACEGVRPADGAQERQAHEAAGAPCDRASVPASGGAT